MTTQVFDKVFDLQSFLMMVVLLLLLYENEKSSDILRRPQKFEKIVHFVLTLLRNLKKKKKFTISELYKTIFHQYNAMAKKLKRITSLKGKFLSPPKSILLRGDKILRRGKVSGQRPEARGQCGSDLRLRCVY